jgi:hypothetical protein
MFQIDSLLVTGRRTGKEVSSENLTFALQLFIMNTWSGGEAPLLIIVRFFLNDGRRRES